MQDQKLENLLELSLDTPENIREKSENLSAGYDSEDKKWEVILRYNGEVQTIAEQFPSLVPLLGGYAIVSVTRAELAVLAANPQVSYIEKPKALSFAVYEGKQVSCIPPVQQTPLSLSGQGILIGIVDSGIDIYHPDFRNEDGSTRIAGLWDQTLSPSPDTGQSPPEGYQSGVYFSREAIDAFLGADDRTFPSRDTSGHGTHVAGIAAGNGRAGDGSYRGVAYEADLLVVKIGSRKKESFPQTAELMMGVDFCIRRALSANQPLALNLSFGNSYGSHTGTSLIETYLDAAASNGRTTICIGSGNEGNVKRHTSARLQTDQVKIIEFTVAPGEANLGIQLWKQYADRFQITLQAPSGESVILSENLSGSYRYFLNNTDILLYFGEPVPYSIRQEIYMELVPEEGKNSLTSGVWKFLLTPKKIVDGQYDLWMPSGSSIRTETGFLVPDSSVTLTIPSTASKSITVAAYDGNTDTFAPFSGRGYVCCQMSKPDLAAPGVNIRSCAPGGGYTNRTGTSMACPFVTGSAALLMQYGILRGKDPYLYGEKLKAHLIRGARPLPAFSQYPNEQVGWGALCLKDSL